MLFGHVHRLGPLVGDVERRWCGPRGRPRLLNTGSWVYEPASAEDRRIWLRAQAAGPHRLVLEVEDRGPGVSPCERRSIFRPFRRGRGADVAAGGVGLGLALAQRWARLLGGSLTLENCPSRSGACFRLELPLG